MRRVLLVVGTMTRTTTRSIDALTPTTTLSFLRSALTVESPFHSVEQVVDWLQDRRRTVPFHVQRIPLSALEKWSFDPTTKDLSHDSGKFFRIEGRSVELNGPVPAWDQPIINQPEIGILGIITRIIDGVPYFMMQAKIEPGNVTGAQLSPTVQATRSNFSQVHGGKLPLFMEYFLDRSRARTLVDQLQSEQGARFLRKRNRNMIVQVDHEIPLPDGFCWLTLGQLKQLITYPNVVNMDARSVLSCVPFVDQSLPPAGLDVEGTEALIPHPPSRFGTEVFRSLFSRHGCRYSVDELLSWFTELKSRCELKTAYKPLGELDQWLVTGDEIRHESGEYFSVIGVQIQTDCREVSHWTQPLVSHPHVGLIGYLAQKINGLMHFLVHAHSEPGVFDLIEMSPTVICSAPQRHLQRPGSIPFLDRFLDPNAAQVRFDTIQSEEGGRFYHVQNRYMILEVPPEETLTIPDDYVWMTLGQIVDFMRHNNYFNIEARGLLACMNFL